MGSKESFGNKFKAACKAAGVPGSAHGVRKIATPRAANAGATVAELEAIFGWQGGAMPLLYTRAADRPRLALKAMLDSVVWFRQIKLSVCWVGRRDRRGKPFSTLRGAFRRKAWFRLLVSPGGWTIDRGNWPLTGHFAKTALTDAMPLGCCKVSAQFLCRSARTVAGGVALDTPSLSQRACVYRIEAELVEQMGHSGFGILVVTSDDQRAAILRASWLSVSSKVSGINMVEGFDDLRAWQMGL